MHVICLCTLLYGCSSNCYEFQKGQLLVYMVIFALGMHFNLCSIAQ